MDEKLPVSESTKPSQPPGAGVGQYVPQVFMVPYYAPHPGFNNYSQGQQHPAGFGQMPGGIQPAPMPLPGMPGPMPMTAIPVPSCSGSSPQTPPVALNKFSSNPRHPTAAKGAINQIGPANEALLPPEASTPYKPVHQNQHNNNNQQLHVPRACWTYVEEEVLVNVYGEYTFGNRMRKMTKVTWEAIAERLFQDSRQQLPQVTMKTWMQCKDKWNNMVKKHKYHRNEYLRRLNSGDYRAIEREGVFEALERILNYETSSSFSHSFEQEEAGAAQENERATMLTNRGEGNMLESSRGMASPHASQQHANEVDTHHTTAGHNEEENVFENYHHLNSETAELISRSPEQSLKRPIEISEEEAASKPNSPAVEAAPKRARVENQEPTIDHRLYEILLRQTELLEQSRNHHDEVLQHMRMSEENTRMMILQAIKDLSTILDRLIKTEN